MDPKVEAHRQECMRLCRRLINEIEQNKNDSALIFGGDLNRKYISVANKALDKTNRVLSKIKNI